jgi:hypothetical protein
MRGEMAGKIKGMTADQIAEFEKAIAGRGRGFTDADEMKDFIKSYDNASKLFAGILSDFNKDGKTDNTDMYAALSKVLNVDLTGYDGDDTGVPLPAWLDSNPKDGKADDAAVVHKNLEAMSPAARMDAISSFQSGLENLKNSITRKNTEIEQQSVVSPEEQKVFDSYQRAGWISPERIFRTIDTNFNTARSKIGDAAFMRGQVNAAQSVVNKMNGFISSAEEQIKVLTAQQEGKTPAGKQAIQARIDKLRAFVAETTKNRGVAVEKLKRNSQYAEAWKMYKKYYDDKKKMSKKDRKDFAWQSTLEWASKKGYNIQ